MTQPQDAVAAIKTKLESAESPWPFKVFDGEPDGTDQPYICIWDRTGSRIREKYTATPSRTRFPFQLSCVARTHDGLRELTAIARSILDWRPVPGASPIVEERSNPILTEGTGNDQRLLAPLSMRCYLPKET